MIIGGNGVLQVSRLLGDETLSNAIAGLQRGEKVLTPLSQAVRPQKLVVQNPGLLDLLCFELDESLENNMGEDEVEIEVRASGPLIRVPVVQCKQIPEGISFEDAATLPMVHYTEYHALVNLARVREGQSILIHAAVCGVGQVAIQMAQHYGLEIFATVGSESKGELIREVYGIQDVHIFNSRDISFVKGLLRMTKGRGVDCVLNSLSGEMLRQTCNSGLDMLPFKKHATFCFFNLENIATISPQLIDEIGEGIFDLLRQGALKPVYPVTVYPVSHMESAFRLMQAGRYQGKLALSYSPDDVVPMLRRTDGAVRPDPNGTYVLVGGFGGLGRSLIRMFAASGARHLAVFSRSGSGCCYAAAGAYEDALAHHRRSQGLKAVTIDLGVMRDSGVLAEQATTANLKDFDSFAISDATLHAMSKKVIVDELSSSTTQAQITTGMPASIDRREGSSGEVSIETQLSCVGSRDEGVSTVQEALVNRVAKFLQTSPGEIDPVKPLEIKAEVSLLEVMSATPIAQLSQKIANRSKLVVD
ncbi:hypothetical protein BJX63DRAFT_435696 [Aspergillus granulosus]|uniref:Enoyl reductase (ER) domain-containing protein n=1 Tax=Aspergillus granulosus TaxID=176169 RepID=A0ABR4H0F0_9EURO